jgi:hypothetical protein
METSLQEWNWLFKKFPNLNISKDSGWTIIRFLKIGKFCHIFKIFLTIIFFFGKSLLLRRTKITLLLVMVSLQIFFSRNYQDWRFIIQLSQAIMGSGLWAFVQIYMERITQQMLIKLTVHCWVYLILTFQIETFTIWSTRLNLLLCLSSIFLAYVF